MIKCPHCNVEIETEDIIDIEHNESTMSADAIGYCPTCGQNYRWTMLYKFDSIKDFEEIED